MNALVAVDWALRLSGAGVTAWSSRWCYRSGYLIRDNWRRLARQGRRQCRCRIRPMPE
ncbi:hypothetical protein ACIP6X_33870 [Streptomyces coeruleorubidus]|uniref:hypothetical protein n=1 Tax=Streptomyces coeruleorubidus TaxID=116188 RepID=UPI003801E63C